MAYYYVKSGLTGTGDQGRYASQQTGAFPTGTGGYASLSAALSATTAPTNGDYICVSDSHTNTSPGALSFSTTFTGDSLTIISVSDSNCDQYSAGASEEASAAGLDDFSFNGLFKIIGMDLKPPDFIDIATATVLEFIDSNVGFYNINQMSMANDGIHVILRNCVFDAFSATNTIFNITNAATLDVYNSSFTQGGTTGIDNIVTTSAQSGGASARFFGCDLSGCDTAIITGLSGSVQNEDAIEFYFERCQMNASASFVDSTLTSKNQHILAVHSASSSAAAEYQYYFETRGGVVQEETSIYRDGSTAFPSTAKISLKVVTDTNATLNDPFAFFAPSRYVTLSSTASDVMTIYFITSATLDDGDIWAQAIYPDGTNNHTPNIISSVTNPFDPFRTAGSLSTNTESWTGRTSENRYELQLDTSGDAGADTIPIIRIYVSKASTTIYICPTLGLS